MLPGLPDNISKRFDLASCLAKRWMFAVFAVFAGQLFWSPSRRPLPKCQSLESGINRSARITVPLRLA
jgi:hypothetical protein